MQKLSHSEILEKRHSVEEMHSVSRFPFCVLLNNIRSMHNVGSIFRTADAACIEKVYICGYTACPPREEIEKTALGSTRTVPWHYFKNGAECIQFLKSKGYTIIALEHTDSSINIYRHKLNLDMRICVILGNEVFGIDSDLLDLADYSVEIPMYGMKHSLNVAVAFGISVYQFIQQYESAI
ncbi:MAG: RNA methyltransferase [Calditrichaeota bacterium]|nr:RNA methyltransferase [Calditrichota bacterium]